MTGTLRRLAQFLVVVLTAAGSLAGQETEQEIADGYSVDDVLGLVRERSAELDVARLQIRKAEAAGREAKAARGPTITLQGSGSGLTNPTEGIKIEKGAFGYAPTPQSAAPVALPDQDYVIIDDAENTYFKITATLSQPLFTWGKLRGAAEAAGLGIQVAEREYESKTREIDRRVRLAYFGSRFAGRAVGLLDRAEETAAAIVADRKLAFDEGVITRQQVLEAAANKASIASQAAAAREAERSARTTLSVLTGGDFSAADFTSDYRDALPEIDEEVLVARGVKSSPSRAAVQNRIEQARTRIGIERGSRPFLPDISLNVSLDVTGQRIPVIGANWTESWDANLIITVGSRMTILDSGASASRIEQGEYDLEIARSSLEALEQSVEIAIRQAIESVRTGWYEKEKAAADFELAKETERNAQVSFENELITRAEMLGARLGSIISELALERARYSYEVSLVELEAATGELP